MGTAIKRWMKIKAKTACSIYDHSEGLVFCKETCFNGIPAKKCVHCKEIFFGIDGIFWDFQKNDLR